MYNNRCCVVSCGSRRKDVKLFKFPKAKVECEMWLKYIHCDRLRSLCYVELCKRRVCQKHFEERFIISSQIRPRLRIGALPSLFTDSKIAGSPQTTYNTDSTSGPTSDHNYCKIRKHEDHTYSRQSLKYSKIQ